MDRGMYVPMTGAKQIMQAQAVNNHNIANLSTIGYRADTVSFDSEPIYGAGYATRVNSVAGDGGTDFSTGVMQTTGRNLDVAVTGNGFIAVRGSDGARPGGLERIGAAGDPPVHPGQHRQRRHHLGGAAGFTAVRRDAGRPDQAGQPLHEGPAEGR